MSESFGQEKRNYKRIPFIAEVLLTREGQILKSMILDISLKGMLLDAPDDSVVDAGAVYKVELVLGEDVSIRMEASIVRQDSYLWGMQWENIDIESLSHLRRLLELNLNDADEMHREIAELG
ncbi:MAG: PilZ domain-containing protein [Gammaproteobacteria bacterium]|nr:PilZ domain-containing protein [Gammaproteobacteria bacterium]